MNMLGWDDSSNQEGIYTPKRTRLISRSNAKTKRGKEKKKTNNDNKGTNEVKKEGTATYGVLALVCPPVGPAVPLSLTVYVDFNVPRT